MDTLYKILLAAHGLAAELLRSLPALRHYFEHRARFQDGLAL